MMYVHVSLKLRNNPAHLKSIVIEADPKVTIDGIKEEIFTLTKIPPDQQDLTPSNRELWGQLSLEAYYERIMKNSVYFDLCTSYLLPQEIFIETMTAETISLNVTTDATIKDIKTLLQPLVNIPRIEQRLFFADLKNHRTLSDCNILGGGTLCLVQTITLYIKVLSSDIINLEVGPNSTVEQLKVKIESIDGTLREKQRLIFWGQHQIQII